MMMKVTKERDHYSRLSPSEFLLPSRTTPMIFYCFWLFQNDPGRIFNCPSFVQEIAYWDSILAFLGIRDQNTINVKRDLQF